MLIQSINPFGKIKTLNANETSKKTTNYDTLLQNNQQSGIGTGS